MIVYLQMIERDSDKSKFEQIYRTYRSLMFIVANRILHNDADAEDAVHQAFVRIAENIEKIFDPVCPKTQSYVVIIVERLAIDLYRKQKRHPSVELDDRAAGLAVSPPKDGGLAAAILRLPQRDRSILLLRYDNGYSSKEVAELLGISVAAVRKAEQRAKAKLKELLEEEGIPV